MTLLLASTGLVTQYPTSTWWSCSEKTERLADRNPSVRVRQPETRTERLPRGPLIVVAVTAFATFLLTLVSINDRAGGVSKPIDQSESSETPRPVPQPVLEISRSLPSAGNPFATTAFVYSDSKTEAKTVLGDDPVSMPDAIRIPPPALDREIDLVLPGSSFVDLPPSNFNRKQVSKSISRLARVTVYYPEEGDFYTRNRKSSTGVRLRDGHCAVDPRVIPYGSVVHVPQIGSLIAVDTGGAVKSRRAAKRTGRTLAQRNAIVVDVFCSSRSRAKALIKRMKHFAVVTWELPKRSAGL